MNLRITTKIYVESPEIRFPTRKISKPFRRSSSFRQPRSLNPKETLDGQKP